MIIEAKTQDVLTALRANREAYREHLQSQALLYVGTDKPKAQPLDAYWREKFKDSPKVLARMMETHAEKEKQRVARMKKYLALEEMPPGLDDHTIDYDRAIAALQAHQGETIMLSQEEYDSLVGDVWPWPTRPVLSPRVLG